MANKLQIKKFLENKSQETLSKIKEEGMEKIQDATTMFFEAYKSNFDNIKNKVLEISVEYDNLTSTIEELGIAEFKTKYYGNPKTLFNELISTLATSGLKNYITIDVTKKIKSEYDKRYEDTKSEFEKLIAVTQSTSAKDAIVILENLGFDLSELDKPKETAALTTVIDASKLFVNKELR